MKWKIETIAIEKLQEWEGNPRKISMEDLEELKRSFTKYAQARTLTVNPIGKGRYEIIGGNQSLRALRELGYEQIQVSVPDKALTETQKRELAIMLNHRNKGEGVWDFDILKTWEDFDFQQIGLDFPEDFDSKNPAKEDNYQTPTEIKTDIEPGDLIEITGGALTHRLVCFRNHAKIYAGYGPKFAFGIETSANINTNPRTENGCITIGREIFEFYRQFFDGVISIVKADETEINKPIKAEREAAKQKAGTKKETSKQKAKR